MSREALSLLDSAWLPVRRASDARVKIRPAELTSGIEDDPIVAFDWPRPDLDAASREFIIGLLSTACCRQVVHGWEDWWAEPPDSATLDAWFAPLGDAFLLDGPGPRFLQDREELDAPAKPVEWLLINAPQENTLEENRDLFVKRGQIVGALTCCGIGRTVYAQ